MLRGSPNPSNSWGITWKSPLHEGRKKLCPFPAAPASPTSAVSIPASKELQSHAIFLNQNYRAKPLLNSWPIETVRNNKGIVVLSHPVLRWWSDMTAMNQSNFKCQLHSTDVEPIMCIIREVMAIWITMAKFARAQAMTMMSCWSPGQQQLWNAIYFKMRGSGKSLCYLALKKCGKIGATEGQRQWKEATGR